MMAHQPAENADLYLPVEATLVDADADVPEPFYFPPPTTTTVDGLVCVGGLLKPDWLLDAYRHGIFPWPVWHDEPMAWWSPHPRAVLEFDRLHISRRLARRIRSGTFRVTCNQDFAGVIEGCATAPGRRGETWLTPHMIAAYRRMHALGHAHSIEVWHGDQLAGGTYGVAIGGLFAAESMFYRVTDASKVAVAHLVGHLQARGYQLLDVQQWTEHTASLGVEEIPRIEYLRRLAATVEMPVTFGSELSGEFPAR
jgi:leucyl/phenylalanyl-tRNA--protein transferase